MCKEVYSRWSNNIYPCSESDCDFVGSLDAFTFGQCYNPCPKCGGKRRSKTGRFVYQILKNRFIPFLKTKKFVRVEYRK